MIKLDGGTGNEVWRYQERPADSTSYTATYPGVGSVSGVAVDGDDNVFLVGVVVGSFVDGEGDPGDADYFIIKLDGTDGSEIWAGQGGGSTSYDSLRAVKADPTGNIVVAGIGGDDDSVNFAVMKYGGATGSFLWEYATATLFTHDTATSIDVDAVGDAYVAGGFDSENLQVIAVGLLLFDRSLDALAVFCALIKSFRGLWHCCMSR